MKRHDRRERALQRERLPELLRPLFWDYGFARLSWERDRDLIIGRILAVGSWDAVQWLRAHVSADELHDWLQRRRGAGLSRKQLRFWQLVLDLPTSQVDAWLADPTRTVWDQRGRA